MNIRSWVIGLLTVWVAIVTSAAEKVKPVTGSYKDALRKAGEAGKPLMIDFYTDWCPQCKRLDTLMHQIPDTVKKFAYYRVNAEVNVSLAKQFSINGYPTVVIIKPDGQEMHRWAGAYSDSATLQKVLDGVVEKVGPIEAKPKAKTPQSAAAETTANSRLKAAEMQMKVNKNKDAAKILQEILDKYPDTEASAKAEGYLEKLGGGPK